MRTERVHIAARLAARELGDQWDARAEQTIEGFRITVYRFGTPTRSANIIVREDKLAGDEIVAKVVRALARQLESHDA